MRLPDAQQLDRWPPHGILIVDTPEAAMNATVQKWGNSLALRIPRSLAKDAHLHQGTMVELAVVEGGVLLKPKKRRKVGLAQMLKGITAKNLHEETKWGAPVGKELW
jgi:antitoxin MazE